MKKYYIYTISKTDNQKYYYIGNLSKENRFQYTFDICKQINALSFFNKNLAKYYINTFNNKKKAKGIPLWIHGNEFFIEEI